MSKNLLQDMVKIKRINSEVKARPRDVSSPKMIDDVTNKPANKTKHALWGVAVVSLIFFIFSISYLFTKVTVTVNPKIKNVTLNENLSAFKDGGTKDGGTEALSFDLIVIGGEENKMVQTTEQKDVLQKAEGSVLIYNIFSSAPQMLSVDTRLEGSNGKIYKTKKQIWVPGMKGNLPGSIEVGIYGAEAGEEYNSIPLDFTIFGFRGTPKYLKFYARSKGSITGGFKGKSPFISDSQKVSILNDLKTTLKTKLFKKATDQIPNGFILFKDATFVKIDDSNIDFISSKDNVLPVKVKGTLYGFLFDESKLTKKIVQNNIEKYDGSPVSLLNLRDLIFSMPNKDSIVFTDVKNINFNLKGATKIVWKLDEDKFIADLLGKSKKDFNQILSQYPNIDSADLVISPFWKTSLSDKSKNIKVIVNYPK